MTTFQSPLTDQSAAYETNWKIIPRRKSHIIVACCIKRSDRAVTSVTNNMAPQPPYSKKKRWERQQCVEVKDFHPLNVSQEHNKRLLKPVQIFWSLVLTRVFQQVMKIQYANMVPYGGTTLPFTVIVLLPWRHPNNTKASSKKKMPGPHGMRSTATVKDGRVNFLKPFFTKPTKP